VLVNNAFSKLMRLSEHKFTEQVCIYYFYILKKISIVPDESNLNDASSVKDDGLSVI
jgi:hypothetical protein